MSKTGILAVTTREISRMRSKLIYPAVTLVLPLLVFFIFIVMFSQGVSHDLPVAVLDNDNSAMSRKLVRMIDSLPSAKVVAHVIDMNEGKTLIQRCEAYSLVVIPRNFERDIMRMAAPKVFHYYNNQYMVVGSILNKDVYSVVRTLSAGININTRMKKGEPSYQAKINIQPIEIQSHVLFNPYTNYMYYLVSSFLPTMLHMFVILSAIYCFGVELKDKTAGELIALAGGSATRAIIGKLIPYIVIFTLLGLFMNTLLFKYFDVPMRGSFTVLMLATIMMIFAYQAAGIVFVSVTANLRMALMSASFYSTTAYTFIGMTFPIISFPLPAKIYAMSLPLYHFMQIFIEQSVMGAPLYMAIPSFAALFIFILLPFVFAGRFLKVMTHRLYWGGV